MAELRKIEIPEILKEIPQIVELYKLTDEFISKLEDDAGAVADDAMIDTSTDYGLARREKILGITANTSDDEDARRMRIKSEWTAAVVNEPVSRKFIEQKIRSFFDDKSASISINYETMQLEISIHDKNIKKAQILCEYINKYLPVNMWYTCDDSIYSIVIYSIQRCGVRPIRACIGISKDVQVEIRKSITEDTYVIKNYDVCGKSDIGAISARSEKACVEVENSKEEIRYRIEKKEKCGENANTGRYERKAVTVDKNVKAIATNIGKVTGSQGCGIKSNISSKASVLSETVNLRNCGIYRCRA